MIKKPRISIIVPAYNEEEMISECLLSLKKQDYDGEFEIIVVNNGSTDQTEAIAFGMGARVVTELKQGYVHALRAGFSVATGDIIACTDADTLVPTFWLSRICQTLSKKGTVACSGIFNFHDGPRIIRFIGKTFGCLNYHLAGANMAVWKTAYLEAGGFDPHVNMGADVELGQRLKQRGKVAIDRKLVASTSGRRFQYAFFQTLILYYLNDLWLLILRRPLFYNFPNIRTQKAKRGLASRATVGKIAVATIIAVSFLLISENTENPLFGSIFAHGQSNKLLVALTFDDGPSMYTNQILDTLAKYNVKATFFMIGNKVDKYPDIAHRVAAEGHTIGNHTYSHPLWAPVETPKRFHRELDKTAIAIHKATSQWPVYFRPPHGWRSPWMMTMAKKENYTVVTWTVSPDDWQNISASTIEQRVLSKTGRGGIILMHDGLELKTDPHREKTIDALPVIISGLKERGYQFVTVPELIQSSEESIPKTVTHVTMQNPAQRN